MEKTEAQTKRILKYLKRYGSITQFEALSHFDCFRLASRIFDLREKGYPIKTEMILVPSGKRIAQYKLSWDNKFEIKW